MDQLLNTGSDPKKRTSSDDYVHTSVQTEQPPQNEEPHPPEKDPDPHAAPDDPNITEPPETNSETAAGIAQYSTRTHCPPEYFRITSLILHVYLKLEEM